MEIAKYYGKHMEIFIYVLPKYNKIVSLHIMRITLAIFRNEISTRISKLERFLNIIE